MTRDELAGMIDHTQLAADTAERDIDRLCEEAAEYGFACVSINPTWIVRCAERLAGTGVGANATIGFPLGANTTHVKAAEARDAVERGATEVDMVMNVGALKSGFVEQVEQDIAAVVEGAGAAPVKVILETSLLDDVEKATACEIAVRAGAAFVKTATGFGPGGATVEDIRLMRRVVGDRAGVKAAGGIRSWETARAMIKAGASRIGTSSAIRIIEEFVLQAGRTV